MWGSCLALKAMKKEILTFVLFFVPLITGMSGNIGIQCSTVLVRSMAIGTFSSSNRKEIIFKEFCSGLFAGLFFGVLLRCFNLCAAPS